MTSECGGFVVPEPLASKMLRQHKNGICGIQSTIIGTVYVFADRVAVCPGDGESYWLDKSNIISEAEKESHGLD